MKDDERADVCRGSGSEVVRVEAARVSVVKVKVEEAMGFRGCCWASSGVVGWRIGRLGVLMGRSDMGLALLLEG